MGWLWDGAARKMPHALMALQDGGRENPAIYSVIPSACMRF
jgi:hypothetical protein